MSTKEEIASAFTNVGLEGVSDDILSKCVSLASTLHTTPKQMADVWDAYSLTKNVDDLTPHTFAGFRNDLFKQNTNTVDDVPSSAAVVARPGLGKRNLPMVTPPPSNNKRTAGNHLTEESGVDSVATTGSTSPTKSSSVAVTPISKYNERKDAEKVEVTYQPNDNLMDVTFEETETTAPKCVLSYDFETNVPKPYRHMFTTLEERAQALDDRLVTMGDCMVERYEMDKDEEIALQPVGVPGEDVVRCVGRICSEAHQGKMNQTSVVLEGCRHVSNGCRINVDLSKLKESKAPFSLFPGQIVALEGVNHCGRDMVAHKICEGVAPVPNKSTVEELLHYHYQVQNGQPLQIMSVCGPYTTSDNLEYAPLLDLMHVIQREKPDLVILTGPFVDLRHALVRDGDLMLDMEDGTKMNVDYDAFFANKVAAYIEGLFEEDEELHTQFVLVPSMEDASAEWVYPQAPLTDRVPNGGKAVSLPGLEGLEFGTLGLHHVETAGNIESKNKGHRRVHCVSNPCTLKVNEVVIGIGSNDVLFDLNKNATHGNLVPGTTIARMAQHLLLQQSYYPLFPAEETTSIDFKHLRQCDMPCPPDVLIVPSKLQRFARTVLDHTVVVNPGYLSRGPTGGTFATMTIHPIPRETLENAGGDKVEMQHDVQDRIKVEIKRI